MKIRQIPIEDHFMFYHNQIQKIYQTIFPSQQQSNQLQTSENDVFLELID